MYLFILLLVGWLFFDLSRVKRRLRAMESAQPVERTAAEAARDTAAETGAAGEAIPQAEAPGPWQQDSGAADGAQGAAADPEGDIRPADRGEDPSTPPARFVLSRGRAIAIGNWLRANWVLAVAAVSLALAGVFLVQYGVENGLVTPLWRVIGALTLGAALVAGGEFVRRRWGDEADTGTAYLPSTLAGAGLVVLFAALLSAEHLYGLLSPGATLAGLVAVAALGVVLGWFYGPYLSAVALTGGMLAPFTVGGQSAHPEYFQYYFALLVVVGLAIDTVKRWAWLSVLVLILGFGAAWMVWSSAAGAAGLVASPHFLAFGLIAAVATLVLPARSLTPRHEGAMVLSPLARIFGATAGPAEFPVRIGTGAMLAVVVSAFLVVQGHGSPAEDALALGILALIFAAQVIWLHRASALDDAAMLTPLALLAAIGVIALDRHGLAAQFWSAAGREAGTAAPRTVTVLAALGLGAAVLAELRAGWTAVHARAWSLLAALAGAGTMIVLEFFWRPAAVIGATLWAFHAMAAAVVLAGLALRTARAPGVDRARIALLALGAVAMIALSLILVLSTTALTVALAILVLGAVMIDARHDLAALAVLVPIGSAVIGWRLVLDPGIGWAENAPWHEVWFVHLAVAALMASAGRLADPVRRAGSRATAESAAWFALAVLLSVLAIRGNQRFGDSAVAGALAFTWLASAAVQLYRLKLGGWVRWIRMALALIFGLIGLGALALGYTFLSPLSSWGPAVSGPPLFGSLFASFALPAVPLAVAARFGHLPRWLRTGFATLAGLLAATWVAFEIRRFWHGPDISGSQVLPAENYSYTVALLILAMALLFTAFWRRSVALRRLAVAGIAVTIAKVFLVDMSELAGLLRVASFLGLGLSLVALGWVVRRMNALWDIGPGASPGAEPS